VTSANVAAIIETMEALGHKPEDILAVVKAASARTARQDRNARYYEKKQAERLIKTPELDASGSEKKSPPDPLKEKPLPKENPPKGGQKKGVRLPDDWQPTPEDRAYGGKLGFSGSEIDGMAEDLRLWAAAASGQVALKRDWGSAFKGWMRREARKRPPGAKVLPFATASPQPREEYSEAERHRRLKEWQERGFYEATK
jgi:hypothetical protein